MSMKQYLSLKLESAKERLARAREGERERIDDSLPLGLRIGSRVQLSEAPFLLAGENSHVDYPGEEALVSAFSETTLAGLKTHRLYLDDRTDTDQESMLLLVSDDTGSNVEEMYLFREQYEIPLYHIRVEDAQEDDETSAVDFWLDREEGIIGMPRFHTPDELTYERLWEPDRDVRISPYKSDEKIFLDGFGEASATLEHQGTMLYGRVVEGIGGDIDEYLLITVERDEQVFQVRIWIGLAISQGDVDFPDAV